MKRQTLAIALFSCLISIGASAASDDFECSPQCIPIDTVMPIAEPNLEKTPASAMTATVAANPCAGNSVANVVKQAESINDRVKPIRELIGYVRTPQSLAIKLVNDHIVRIPPWVGFAMDPVGTIKNRAIGEAKDWGKARAKEAFGLTREQTGTCAANPLATPVDVVKPDAREQAVTAGVTA